MSDKQPVAGACAMDHASKKRWEDSRHAGMINWVAEAIQQESTKLEAAEFNRFWNNSIFNQRLLAGLRDADYVNPYYNTSTFTSHFYDADTEMNYIGQRKPTAKTEALDHFRQSLARRQEDRNGEDAPTNIHTGYELGLSLHYVTDLSQPMHAANFINTPLFDMRHASFEKYAENYQDHFIVHTDRRYLDRVVLSRVKSIEDLLKQMARHAKSIYNEKLKPFLDSPRFVDHKTDKWPDDPESKEITEDILANTIPIAELHVAALLLHWTRGYHSIVTRIFQRLLDRAPDAEGHEHYGDRLANGTYTVRKIVSEVGGSDEYFKKKVENKSGAERRKLFYSDLLNRDEPDALAKPTESDLKHVDVLTWRRYVDDKVGSPEYGERFGEEGMPGYEGLSAVERPRPR